MELGAGPRLSRILRTGLGVAEPSWGDTPALLPGPVPGHLPRQEVAPRTAALLAKLSLMKRRCCMCSELSITDGILRPVIQASRARSPVRQEEMQTAMLHTHLCPQPCLGRLAGRQAGGRGSLHWICTGGLDWETLPPRTASPDPAHLTPTMHSSPQGQPRGAHGVPFASSPAQPQESAHPGVVPPLQSDAPEILHPFSLRPVVPAGLSCPSCPALSDSPGCTASPSPAAVSTPARRLSGRQDLEDPVSDPWALPRLPPQLLPAPGPHGTAANLFSLAGAAGKCSSAKALSEITAEGWQLEVSRGAAPRV